LAIADGEKGQELLPLHDLPPVVHHRCKTGTEAAQFIFLAVIERHALAVLAEAHEVEAEVRLVFLLVEVERNERLADPVGEPSPYDRIADGHPNHITVDDVGRADEVNLQGARYRPENPDERAQGDGSVEKAQSSGEAAV